MLSKTMQHCRSKEALKLTHQRPGQKELSITLAIIHCIGDSDSQAGDAAGMNGTQMGFAVQESNP